jgi:hypothetical protein
MTTINLNPREFWSLAVGGAILCFCAGVLMACITVAVVLIPMQEQQLASAHAKGAMLKIAASKARCQQWELKARKAVCDE